jgi:amidohydrolase
MANDWQTTLNAIVDEQLDAIVAMRRRFHANPEPSGNEFNTSLHLYQLLGDRGLPVRMGPEGRGLFVESRHGDAPGRIALRADIDALYLEDRKDVPYRSQTPGVMHACGHDVHAAMTAGVLVCLDELEARGALPWPISWRGIFQPSEETATGAMEMIEAGAVDGIDAILTSHVDPTREVGTIGIRNSLMTANCDAMRILVHGVGGHAARPHESNDPIAAAAQLISTIYQFVPRGADSHDAVVVTVGEIRGGENPNVIPEQVSLRGTLRTLDRAVRESTIHHILQLSRGIEEISGTRVDVEFERSILSVRNDPGLTQLLCETFDRLFGAQRREKIARPSMGSEDFACYLEHVPGAMFRLGSATDPMTAPGLHTPNFDIDERAIGVGAKLLSQAVVAWCSPAS